MQGDIKPRVLVVDDEPAIRRQLGIALAQRGYEAESVADGVAALAALAAAENEQRPFDQVVTDIRLPDIDGLKLLAIIRSRHPRLPVVVISGYGGEGTAEAVQRRHHAAFLPKPVGADQLVAAFRTLAAEPPGEAEASGPGWREPRAYVFVQLAADADPERVFTSLFTLPHVQRVDAVRGSADVVLRLDDSADASDILPQAGSVVEDFVQQRVRSIPGVAVALVRRVAQPELPPSIRGYVESYERRLPADLFAPGRATAYAVVEIAPPAMASLYPSLFFLDEAVEVAATANGDAVILLLQAEDHAQIRGLLNEKVRYTDGVLRIDELMVVNMFEVTPTE